jgi:hypothetical protein
VVNLFQLQSLVLTVIALALFLVEAWALIDGFLRRPDAYVAADKMTKPAWLIILGLALVAHLLIANPFQLLNLAGAVAAIVYLVDARPALRAVTRHR